MFEHPKKALGGLAKKCPTRLALRTAKKCALQTPARSSWLDQLLARSPEAGAHRHKKRCWPWIHNLPTGKHIKMSSFCGPDAHDPQGRSSQFKYYPHLLALSNPKKSRGRGGRTPPCAPPRRRCAAPGLGCAQPKSPKPHGSRPSRAKLKHRTKVQFTGVRGLRKKRRNPARRKGMKHLPT